MSSPQVSLDEALLVDYLRGDLSPTAKEALERRLADDSDARQIVAALAGLSIFSATTSGLRSRSESEDAAEQETALLDPVAGELLSDKYRVVAPLGRGAMGVVVEVEHVLLRERYALKLLRRATASDPLAVRRLVREARAAMRIDSRHVARVFDLGVLPDGRLFLVMELLAGRDLKSVLAELGALPVDSAIAYLRQAALGVRAAHAAGIVHRDLKPANLFVAQQAGEECLKVLDFGLSKAPEVHRRASDDASLTTSGSMIGSPMYMAPEQIRDAKCADARSDVWALGVVFYEMLTGRTPYAARTISGVLATIMVDAPQPCGEKVPAAIERILLDCLAKAPEQRIASAEALLDRLDHWQEDAVRARTARTADRTTARRRRWPFVAAALVIAGGSVAILSSRPRPAAPNATKFGVPVAAFTRALRARTPSVEITPPPPPSAPRASAEPRSPRASGNRKPIAPSASVSPADEVVFGRETEGRK